MNRFPNLVGDRRSLTNLVVRRLGFCEAAKPLLIRNRRCFNSVSDKIINKGIQNIIHGCEYMPIVLMAGTGIGTCIGSYHGYQESKKDTYLQCMFMTVCFGYAGGGIGYLLTIFCPVTVPIVIVATFALQMEPVIEPEKKESDIYTLRDKRPT